MKMPMGYNYSRVKNLLNEHQLHTICSSGNCPNIGECWGNGTATFMILGEICTRNCRFCGVKTGKPMPADPLEPMRIARSVKLMELKHVVITSVDRDDLPDKGAGLWAETIRTVKAENPGVTMEVLIPDFDGQENLIDQVIQELPEVISHNLETVRRLTPQIRSRARYERSLDVLRYIASEGISAKSGIMLGLGETREEVLETMDDLLEAGCRIMTMGQYLAPTRDHLPVKEYLSPDVFQELKMEGLSRGFLHVESHPLVRSSYHAEKHVSKKNNVLNEL
jgi:lipoyl synthase